MGKKGIAVPIKSQHTRLINMSIIKPRLVPLFGLLCCTLLAMTAFSKLMASLYLLYPQQIDNQYRQKSSAITLNQHRESEIAIKKALQWNESPEAWQYLSIAQTRQLQDAGDSAQRLLQEIYQNTINGLGLSPVDPYNWYRLAVIKQILHHPSDKIIGAIRLSCYAGRVEPTLLLKRIRLLQAYRNQLNDEMQDILHDQIRLAALLQFRRLIQLAYEQPDLIPVVGTALQHEPELWHRFQQSLDKLTRNSQIAP